MPSRKEMMTIRTRISHKSHSLGPSISMALGYPSRISSQPVTHSRAPRLLERTLLSQSRPSNQPHGAAEFINPQGHMPPPPLKFLQKLVNRLGFGHHKNLPQQAAQHK